MLKKMFALISAAIISYSIYYDIHAGTIPSYAQETPEKSAYQNTVQHKQEPFATVRVNPGDTVLTIVEKLSGSSKDLSIEKIIRDFSRLNNGIAPEDIQIGQTYRFPIYHASH
ncbi:hypothetical protein BpJC7_08650 [Weizmannia acidilactici]|mgnify:CR=1 FL=1|uniref:LysM domain-containing protein n=1 Tax=Weizmannia acidilactici TaxID=2607726 RepID=A0A5J4J3I6_9BACI|nr:LysM domain-containing protein [Weizmannia acidilactici]GER66909.1 hypothetical protein BpJC4_13800 [Weizmannia acidilactici]GER69562.1 hypothetical protein BpJC7_08650 [Weizmannia acidilactici]GER72761.1 hypothetical protein BpPP18_08280 [Weizmannia acidilactici]